MTNQAPYWAFFIVLLACCILPKIELKARKITFPYTLKIIERRFFMLEKIQGWIDDFTHIQDKIFSFLDNMELEQESQRLRAFKSFVG